MLAARPLAPPISEALTWVQICERYPDQHVYLIDAERDDPLHPAFQTARVIGAGKTWKESLEQARAHWAPDQLLEHRFTGRSKKPLLRPRGILDDETRDAIRL